MDDLFYAFAAQARSYCSLVEEESSETDSMSFARVCLVHLISLYQLALQLPRVKSDNNVRLLERPDDEAWKKVLHRMATRLRRDYYWTVEDDIDRDMPDPTVGSLADDLADIWRDLKPGLLALDTPSDVVLSKDISWHWEWHFRYHWGTHAANAIAVLHGVCFRVTADYEV